MNRKKLILETTIFSSLLIILFIAFSLTFFFITRKTTNDDLLSTLKVAENIFNKDDADNSSRNLVSYYKDYDDYRISIIKKKDNEITILYDSKEMKTIESANALELEEDNLNHTITRKSSYGYNMIYVANKVEDSDYFIRVAIKETTALALSRGLSIYGSIIVVILDGLYIGYRVYEYNKSVKPLKDQIQRLNAIAGNTDKDKLIDQGDDLAVLSDAVDTISTKIDQKLSDLEREKEKNELFLDSISQGFIVINATGNIILFNKAASQIFNYKTSEALNKNYHILQAGETFNSAVSRTLFTNTKDVDFDMRREGMIYKVSVMHLPPSFIDSKKNGLVLLVENVTEEKNLAKTKADFFANASHELKSPLTSILGYQEMIQSGIIDNDEDRKEAIDQTIKEAKRMRALLTDMLSLTRLENNEEKKVIKDINLKDIITQSLATLEPRIEAMQLKVYKTLTDYIVKANEEDMKKLFNNIIENAVKYNIIGHSITIIMDIKNHTISIDDTGIGIKEENLSRIFERFYRVDNSRGENNIEGTGLGLAIVKHIVELYDYKIVVSSIYGNGTSFTIKTK